MTIEKKARDLTKPASRSSQAVSFLNTEPKQAPPAQAPLRMTKADERKLKASSQFMHDHGITDISSLDFTRLNCDIPSQLHTWLNVYARSNKDYASMTQIVIEQLGKFALERGFKVTDED